MLKALTKKILWNIKGGYKPQEFWDRRVANFINDPWQRQIHPQHKWLLSIIKKENPNSILEVGCGFGRNIQFLIENGIDPSAITAFDISPNMIKMAREYVNNKKVKLFVSDLTDFKTKKKFDFVFTHGVLMHITSDKIRIALEHILALSKKAAVFIEQNYPPTGGQDNNYTFVHNYKKILAGWNLDIIEYRHDKKLGLDLIYAKVR